MCETILAMAGALNLKVTAEGIELAEQARLLKDMGCSHGQGFYWAKPMSVESALSWLAAGDARI